MRRRSWAYLIALVLIGAAAGTWYYYYRGKCHGMDECAAQAAESRERDTPRDAQ